MRPIIALSLGLLACSAAAYDPIVIARGWYRVAAFEGPRCDGEVGTNGRIYVVSVAGMMPGEPATLTIESGDMRPIEREVRADAAGRWTDYYIPFRFHRDGGQVTAILASESCVVPLDFAWTRANGSAEPALPQLR